MRIFEKLLQQDLNCGIGPATKTNPGGGLLTGTQIGLHTFARGQVSRCKNTTTTVIAAGGTHDEEMTFPGAVKGDLALVTFNKPLQGVQMSAYIDAPDVVTVHFYNPSATAITLEAGVLKGLVFELIGCGAAAGPQMSVDFEMNPDPQSISVDVNQSIEFTPNVQGGTGPYTFLWDFGDGNTSTDEVPTHTYSTPSTGGTYTVTCTVTDSLLATAQHEEIIDIAGV